MNSKKRVYNLLLLLPSFLLATCVNPVDLNVVSIPPLLTVDGLINNDGMARVKLTYSTSFDPDLTNQNYPVTDAIVFLNNSSGEQYPLFEYEFGIYELDSNVYKGVIGEEYWVSIETEDGELYESRPEKLNAVPDIEEIYFEIEDRLTKSFSGFDLTIYGMQFFVRTNDPFETRNHYRWDWTAKREINTVAPPPEPGASPITCCFQCWVDYFPSKEVTILSDERSNGKSIKKQPIVFLEYDSNMPKMELVVSQSSLTAEAYEFWKRVKQQQENAGSVFEPAPAAIIGNIYNVNDPDEVVFGWFGASAITYKKVQYRNIDIPFQNGSSPEGVDCRSLKNSTDVMPEDPFWWY
ncbi:DUF4249 domain-containing protein [Flammeovirgaceae bacterium SG7u.111]|nr:DUF4249 domain-containing protein [Flammeovirgaceae bacterium SG7u.132]WPO33249.1 DUF4249 domain-containing protein [Flammeovirgaceae bacterium SG7u.111]